MKIRLFLLSLILMMILHSGPAWAQPARPSPLSVRQAARSYTMYRDYKDSSDSVEWFCKVGIKVGILLAVGIIAKVILDRRRSV
jgi:hypothetical protein